jgi:predicted glutamine amidotransferase
MCRLVGWVAAQPVSLAEVLGPTALQRLLHLSTVHCDGWGVAWHDEDGRLETARSLRAAHDDAQFAEMASGLRARAGLVHLRLGTPGYGEGFANTHPFVAGDLAFAHNGAIGPHARVDELLRDGDPTGLVGRTDSERYFRAIRDELSEPDAPGLAEAVRRVAARMHERGLRANSLNALLLAPDALFAVSEHDEQWEPGSIPVWPADDLASGLAQPRYLALAHRAEPDRVVVLSSGIISDPDGWTELPSHSVLTIDVASRELRTSPTAAWSLATG